MRAMEAREGRKVTAMEEKGGREAKIEEKRTEATVIVTANAGHMREMKVEAKGGMRGETVKGMKGKKTEEMKGGTKEEMEGGIIERMKGGTKERMKEKTEEMKGEMIAIEGIMATIPAMKEAPNAKIQELEIEEINREEVPNPEIKEENQDLEVGT